MVDNYAPDAEFHIAPAAPGEEPETPRLLSAEEATAATREAIREIETGNPGAAVLIRATMGVGKSVATRAAIGPSPLFWVVFVPTHALGEQHHEELDRLGYGNDVTVRRGVTGLRIDGDRVCLQLVEATALLRAGADPVKRLCTRCPHREEHPDFGELCPAYEDATASKEGRVRFLQNTRAADILAQLKSGDDGKPTVVVFDEPPPLLKPVTLSAADGASCIAYLALLRPAVAERLEPLVQRICRGLDERSLRSGASLLDVLGEGADVQGILESARGVVEIALRAEAERQLANLVSLRSSVPSAMSRARETIEVLREAAFTPKRPLVHIDDQNHVRLCARAPWVRALRRWVSNGGKAIILDGTASISEYRSLLFGGDRADKLKDCELNVRDAAGVKRIYYRWTSGAKSRHVSRGTPRWEQFQGVLRHVATLVQEHGGPLGVITDKTTAQALDREITSVQNGAESAVFPSEFVDAVRKVEVKLGWFGNHRGLDRWGDCRVFATLGDPNPNLGDMQAEAQVLGRDASMQSFLRCQVELAQALGRARPIHRTDDVVIVHYGRRAPWQHLAPQWLGAEGIIAKTGRVRKKTNGRDVSDEELLSVKEAKGLTNREHARQLGISPSTYAGRLKRARGGRAPAASPVAEAHPEAAEDHAARESARADSTNGTATAPERTVNAYSSMLTFEAVGIAVWTAIKSIDLIKPRPITPHGDTGYLFTPEAKNGTPLCHVSTADRIRFVRATFAIHGLRGIHSFVYPGQHVRAFEFVTGGVTFTLSGDRLRPVVEYEFDRGAGCKRRTLDPRLMFLLPWNQNLDAAVDVGRFPVAALRKALKPLIPGGRASKHDPSERIEIVGGTNAQGRGQLTVTTERTTSKVDCDAPSSGRFSILRRDLHFLGKFLATCPVGDVNLKCGTEKSFAIDSAARIFGWGKPEQPNSAAVGTASPKPSALPRPSSRQTPGVDRRCKLSGREILRRLLGSGKLSPGEATVFKRHYDELIAAGTTEVDDRTALWIERQYYDVYKLQDLRAEKRRATRQETHEPKVVGLDAMPRPKKPPGK